MPPDEEQHWKDAFAQLHRQQREHAPVFAAMRDRALSHARTGGSREQNRFPLHRLGWAVPVACAAVVALWWAGIGPEPHTPHVHVSDAMTSERVDELLDSIETHLEFENPALFVEYPTDSLLAVLPADPSP